MSEVSKPTTKPDVETLVERVRGAFKYVDWQGAYAVDDARVALTELAKRLQRLEDAETTRILTLDAILARESGLPPPTPVVIDADWPGYDC